MIAPPTEHDVSNAIEGLRQSFGAARDNASADYRNRAAKTPETRSDYGAAAATRFLKQKSGVRATGSHADYHYRSETEYFRAIETARSMDRDDMTIGAGIRRCVTNILQHGFSPDPQTGIDAVDRNLKQRWADHSNNKDACDIKGKHTLLMQAKLALRHTLVDGDILTLLLNTGQNEQVEATRLRTPPQKRSTRNIIHGVEQNKFRRAIRYHLQNDDVSVDDVRHNYKYESRDAVGSDGLPQVLHTYHPKRVTQSRGVSALSPVLEAIGMHDELQYAKLVQQQVASYIAFIREKPLMWEPPKGYRDPNRYRDSPGYYNESRDTLPMYPGAQINPLPGETVKPFSANVPNEGFFDQAKLILTFVSINLDLPLILFLLDASETNFSGWRGALDQAKMAFRDFQLWFGSDWYRPQYEWKARNWGQEDTFLRRMAANGIPLLSHTWRYPTWPYVEPLKDVQAQLLQVRNGLTSPRRAQAERDRDWEEVSTEIVEDNGLAIVKAKKKAADINAKFADDGNPVHWRELISLPTPDGVQTNLGNDGSQRSSEATGNQE